MHLLFVTFGKNEKNHAQAYFCIYSFLAQNANLSSLNIITDHPQWYKSIEKHVNVIEVSPQILNEWKGSHDYMWRIKIKAIEKILFKYPGEPVLYLDTDTFLYNDFYGLSEVAKNGQAAMHENEGKLKNRSEKSMRMMTNAFSKKSFSGFDKLEEQDMWNAGVILIPNTKKGEDIQQVLQLCDEMCKQNVRPYFIEQFCFSVVLKKFYGLTAASPYIAHYWSNRNEWNEVINAFLLESYLKGFNENETISSFLKIDLRAIAVKRIVKNTNQRLKHTIDRIFPPQAENYLPDSTNE